MIKLKKNEQAFEKVEKYLNSFKTNKDLWTFYLQLNISANANEERLFEIFHKSIESIKQNETLELWETMLDWALSQKSENTEKLLQKGSCIMRQDISTLARLKYLEWAESIGNFKLKEVYSNLRQVPPYSSAFYLKYAEIEKLRQDETQVETAYEDALLHFGAEIVDLWIDYMSYKQINNKAQDIAGLYWRAMKHLNSSLIEDFTQKFCLFKIKVSDETN